MRHVDLGVMAQRLLQLVDLQTATPLEGLGLEVLIDFVFSYRYSTVDAGTGASARKFLHIISHFIIYLNNSIILSR